MAVILGRGYYASFRSGVLTIIGKTYRKSGKTYRRDREPIRYWIGMVIGTLGFLIITSVTVIMAFLLCMDLYGH
jgi:hypothetical protein